MMGFPTVNGTGNSHLANLEGINGTMTEWNDDGDRHTSASTSPQTGAARSTIKDVQLHRRERHVRMTGAAIFNNTEP